MKPTPKRLCDSLLALPLLALAGLTTPAQALQVQANVTDFGTYFHYAFTVLNDDPIPDLVVVSLVDAPLGDPLINGSLTAPAGFLASYDSGLGFVDLLADAAGVFPAGPTGLFGFDSLAAPDQAFMSYQALDATGGIFSGTVDAEIAQTVSSPSALALITAGLACWTWFGTTARRPRFSTHLA